MPCLVVVLFTLQPFKSPHIMATDARKSNVTIVQPATRIGLSTVIDKNGDNSISIVTPLDDDGTISLQGTKFVVIANGTYFETRNINSAYEAYRGR